MDEKNILLGSHSTVNHEECHRRRNRRFGLILIVFLVTIFISYLIVLTSLQQNGSLLRHNQLNNSTVVINVFNIFPSDLKQTPDDQQAWSQEGEDGGDSSNFLIDRGYARPIFIQFDDTTTVPPTEEPTTELPQEARAYIAN